VPDERRQVGAEGSRFQRLDVLLGVVQDLCSSMALITCSRGIASTLPKMSAASVPSTWTVDSEHEPSITVVTPWRNDSDSDGPLSTSTS